MVKGRASTLFVKKGLKNKSKRMSTERNEFRGKFT